MTSPFFAVLQRTGRCPKNNWKKYTWNRLPSVRHSCTCCFYARRAMRPRLCLLIEYGSVFHALSFKTHFIDISGQSRTISSLQIQKLPSKHGQFCPEILFWARLGDTHFEPTSGLNTSEDGTHSSVKTTFRTSWSKKSLAIPGLVHMHCKWLAKSSKTMQLYLVKSLLTFLLAGTDPADKMAIDQEQNSGIAKKFTLHNSSSNWLLRASWTFWCCKIWPTRNQNSISPINPISIQYHKESNVWLNISLAPL